MMAACFFRSAAVAAASAAAHAASAAAPAAPAAAPAAHAAHAAASAAHAAASAAHAAASAAHAAASAAHAALPLLVRAYSIAFRGRSSLGNLASKIGSTDSAKSAYIPHRNTQWSAYGSTVARMHHSMSCVPFDLSMCNRLMGLSSGHLSPNDLRSFLYPDSHA